MRSTPLRLLGASALALSLLAAVTPTALAETYFLDGYEVEVTLSPWRESFVDGEQVMVSLDFKNRADTALELLLSGESGPGWPDDFEVRVTGPDGLPVPRPEGARRDEGYVNSYVHGRRSGGRTTPEVGVGIRLDAWAKFEKPGLYTVAVRRGVKAGPFDGTYRIWAETNKPVVELRAETQVKIVAPGADPIGALIEEQSRRLLSSDPTAPVDAAMRLSELDDERIVPHFVEALRRCRNTNVREAAVKALGRFDSDAAFEGLRLAAADPSDDLRTAAAQALAKSKHPKAAGQLLSMRGDAHFGVRLIVLYALARKETAEARRLIWEMSNDEHPLIREEALRYLQQRGGRRP
jgi:hypothetical protein